MIVTVEQVGLQGWQIDSKPTSSLTFLSYSCRLSPQRRERIQTLRFVCKGYIFSQKSVWMLQTLSPSVSLYFSIFSLYTHTKCTENSWYWLGICHICIIHLPFCIFPFSSSTFCQTFSFRYNDNNGATNNCLLSDRGPRNSGFNVSFIAFCLPTFPIFHQKSSVSMFVNLFLSFF